MNKRLFLSILWLLFPFCAYASCENVDISRYKSLASNVDSYYNFDESAKKFNVVIYNINDEFIIKNTDDGSIFSPSSNNMGEVYISSSPGVSMTLGLYPSKGQCSNRRIRTIYVNLPYYNKYYNDSVCVNNSNKLCSKWANTSKYSYEQFVNKVKIKDDEGDVVNPSKEEYEKKYGFFDFLADYYMLILIMIIISGSYGIYVLDKKSKFDF